jgi:CRISPR-associated protein Cas2
MARRFYLVSYDVADDKRRTRVFKLLRDTGDRVQYSVFCCQLNPRELHALKEAVRERLDREEDQTLFLDAGVVDGQRPEPEISFVGRKWEPEIRSQIV